VLFAVYSDYAGIGLAGEEPAQRMRRTPQSEALCTWLACFRLGPKTSPNALWPSLQAGLLTLLDLGTHPATKRACQ
jgi:hypothetical protein